MKIRRTTQKEREQGRQGINPKRYLLRRRTISDCQLRPEKSTATCSNNLTGPFLHSSLPLLNRFFPFTNFPLQYSSYQSYFLFRGVNNIDHFQSAVASRIFCTWTNISYILIGVLSSKTTEGKRRRIESRKAVKWKIDSIPR